MKLFGNLIIILLTIFGINCCTNDSTIIGKLSKYQFNEDIQINSIEDILKWLKYNITYKVDSYDFSQPKDRRWEYWQLPEETYELRTGDCEDYSIMFMYLAKVKLGIDANLVVVKILPSKSYHAIVKLEKIGVYIEPMHINQKIDVDAIVRGTHIVKLGTRLLPDHYQVMYEVPYETTMWLTYYHHGPIGKYEIRSY